MVRRIVASLALCALLAPLAVAQITGDKIDLYFGDWHNATPRTVRGSLEERDILTRGDAANPTQKGAVLRYVNSYTYDTLAPQASTKPTRLDGQQEIYFVESGQGTVTAGGQTADLYRNIAVLMPANLEFTIKSTGDQPLAMYVINEPTPPGFRPNTAMLVRDENKLPGNLDHRFVVPHCQDAFRNRGWPGHSAKRADGYPGPAHHRQAARGGPYRHRRGVDGALRNQPGIRQQCAAQADPGHGVLSCSG